MKVRKLIISCGGTGGHFFPGLSAARILKSQGGEALLLLSGVNSAAQKEIATANSVPAAVLPEMPSPGNPKKAVCFLIGLVKGFFVARREIRKFAPDAVLGMGSFASLPIMLAAKLSGIRCFLHDGNAQIGRANRILSRISESLWTAFDPVNADRCRCPVACIGMPLRPELVSDSKSMTREEAFARLNAQYQTALDKNVKTLLIVGGSQGASIFNQLLPQVLRDLDDSEIQVIHLAGPKKLDEAKNAYRNCRFRTLLLPGVSDMAPLYHAADLVIARSGGSTVAELMLFGKASVLIPYPYAMEDHQYFNAQILGKQNAAVVLRNGECSAERLSKELWNLLDDPEKLRQMGSRAAEMAHPEAAQTLLELIFQQTKHH